LLGSAANGTLFSKVTISDRKEIDGVNRIDTEFELVVREVGKTSEIPVISASWGVGRNASRNSTGQLSIDTPTPTTFDIKVARG